MKPLFLFFLLILALPALAQKTILESEDARFRAQMQRDTVALQQLLTDDLLYIHSNALVETKTAFINSISNNKIIYEVVQREGSAQIRTYGKTGISNGIVLAKGVNNGTPFDIRIRYTAVYHKQKGAWRLASWQSTRMQ
ncbi:MAG: nuclear transport factor 2 family protein [Saprospiraceae bacterium]